MFTMLQFLAGDGERGLRSACTAIRSAAMPPFLPFLTAIKASQSRTDPLMQRLWSSWGNCSIKSFSGRFGGYGYGYGHGGVGIIGVILIIVVVLLLLGRL